MNDFEFSEGLGSGQLYNWLLSMPEESISRLKNINESTGSAHHVILTLTYGFYDPCIAKLNRMITALLLRRMRAERQGKLFLVERINTFMNEMHKCIDRVTGVNKALNGSRNACNRFADSRKTGVLSDAG